jgi:predicted transglutaminase-like cysteine proteinase
MSKFDELTAINETINKLPYRAEVRDDWTPIVTSGDCDSYATAKYEALVHSGWSRKDLRLATCYVEDGGYHAVLLAELDGQTWVLDNRQPYPTEFSMLPYTFKLLQIAGTCKWEYV